MNCCRVYRYWIPHSTHKVAVKAKFHYATWIEPASNQLRTGSEPDSAMEFGREPASSC